MDSKDLPFNSNQNKQKYKKRYHAVYFAGHFILEQFRNPERKPVPEDLNFIQKMKLLMEPEGIKDEDVKNLKELANLHRITDNTKARKRLEKWSKRVIVTYLLCVLCIITLNYGTGCLPKLLNVPDSIMTIILSTTTVNIIALVVIVLKGHFKDKNKD